MNLGYDHQPNPLRQGWSRALVGEMRRKVFLSVVVSAAFAVVVGAQQPTQTCDPPATDSAPQAATESDLIAILPHHQWKGFWVSGQMNIIEQGHGAFDSLYSGPRSLSSTGEHAASRIFTLYTTARLSEVSDVLFDVEDASGDGISNSNGLGGFTNIDVVRIPGEGSPLSTTPYGARAVFRYIFPLSQDQEKLNQVRRACSPAYLQGGWSFALANSHYPIFST